MSIIPIFTKKAGLSRLQRYCLDVVAVVVLFPVVVEMMLTLVEASVVAVVLVVG